MNIINFNLWALYIKIRPYLFEEKLLDIEIAISFIVLISPINFDDLLRILNHSLTSFD